MTTHWHMMKGDTVVGEVLTITINVSGFPVSIQGDNSLSQASLHPVIIHPSSETARISFDLSSNTNNLTLSVHDVFGKEVAVIAKGHFSAGLHVESFSTAHLSAGVYFWVMTLPSGQKYTRKMLLK
ncbi:MAG: T9SS type A sorting domain-containing protein [Bacteroidia bacterium]